MFCLKYTTIAVFVLALKRSHASFSGVRSF